MLNLQDHIAQLRAELADCIDADERETIRRELDATVAALAKEPPE